MLESPPSATLRTLYAAGQVVVLAKETDPYMNWAFGRRGVLEIGTPAHRDAFCRMLLDTYNPYRPAVIDWPKLGPAELQRIAGLPFWDTAVAIEERAAMRMSWQSENCGDALIAEALALNADEERRHKRVLGHMLAAYDIDTGPEPAYRRPGDPEFAFLRTGYGECINSFVAFGLFTLAERSGFFPQALVDTFEPVVQEEARHILFFANYVAYRRATLGAPAYLAFQAKCALAVAEQFASRVGMGIAARRKRRGVRGNFLAEGAGAVTERLDLRQFLRLCLDENERRMAGYDARLVRPVMMPWLVRRFLWLIGRR